MSLGPSGRSPVQGLSIQCVRSELNKIQASKTLNRSDRLCRLLRFVVEHAITQPSENIKEYTIGTAVFEKPESYDPRSNPIVRVQAQRLRAKLRQYYLTEGSSDSVTIELPVGGYRPVIRQGTSGALAADTGSAFRTKRKTILILPFTPLAAGRQVGQFARALTDEVTDVMAKCERLRVLLPQGAHPFIGTDAKEPALRETIDTVLQGSIRRSAGTLRISVHLVEPVEAAVLWSHIYERRAIDGIAVPRQVARRVCQAILVAMECVVTRRERTPGVMCIHELATSLESANPGAAGTQA